MAIRSTANIYTSEKEATLNESIWFPPFKIYSIEDIIEMELLKIINKYEDLSGLCFLISKELGENLVNFFKTENKDELEKIGKTPATLQYKLVHGEIGFSMDVPSKYWGIQHTWLEIEIYGLTISVDATMKQFKSIVKNIPDYYISREASPIWYLKDENNLKLNKHIIDTKFYNILGWCHYEIVGRIYDFIAKLKNI